MVHFVKRLGKVKVNDIVVIAIQKTLKDVVNVLEEMSEAAATFTKPVLLVAEYAVRLNVAKSTGFIIPTQWLFTQSSVYQRRLSSKTNYGQ